jgi:hypothetical protein
MMWFFLGLTVGGALGMFVAAACAASAHADLSSEISEYRQRLRAVELPSGDGA